MKQFCIVILNHFPELARNLVSSIRNTHRTMPKILVVCDRHNEKIDDDIAVIRTDDDFVFAKNVNLAFENIFTSCEDIILVNDDCECVENEFFPNLAAIADKYNNCGILSPLIDGGVGNELQAFPPQGVWGKIKSPEIIIDRTVCFPCVYINRELIDKIGGLDETFIGYGFDDDDYCLRARAAGFRTMITSSLRIKHGSGGAELKRGSNWSVSFARFQDPKSNIEVFLKKYPQFRAR